MIKENKRNFKETGVSVWIMAYNHEKYIEKCLQSAVTQNVLFPYEIIVHDDASTDATTEIIKKYAEKYPEIIKPIFQKENQYKKPGSIMMKSFLSHTHGKYVAMCEGDDAWTSDSKIQQQYDFMENNKDCSMCTHASLIYKTESGDICPFSAFTCDKPSVLTIKTLADQGEIFHTSSYFVRTSILKNFESLLTSQKIHDFAFRMLLATQGNIGYLPDVMSLYRKGTEGSWTSRMKDDDYRKQYYKYARDLLNKVDEYTNRKYTEYFKLAIKKYNVSGDGSD